MATPDAAALQTIATVLRQLRDIKGVREIRPGTFQFRNAPFAQLHAAPDGSLYAELRKPGGSGFDRFAVDTPPHQRKLIDEARLRAGRLDDE